MEPLLEALTLTPAAQLFELEPPRYTSSYGRRTEAIFKNNVPPAPMLISPDNGLVLYERVISTKAEHQLLDKLTKPKFYHPIPKIQKGDRKVPAARGGAAGGSPPRPRSASSISGRGRPPSPGGQATPAGATGGAAGALHGGRSSQPHPHAAQHPHQPQPPQQPHRSRSFSAGRAPVGANGHPVKRKPLYPEDGPLKDYFSKERASVTATTMFTWGNRYRIGELGTARVVGGGAGGGGGGGGRGGGGGTETSGFSSYSPLQQKPPLRL